MEHINEQWNPIKSRVLVEFLYRYMLKGVANTSQNGKFLSLLPLLCKFSAIFMTFCYFASEQRITNVYSIFFVCTTPYNMKLYKNSTSTQHLYGVPQLINVLHNLCMCKRPIFHQKRSFMIWSVSFPSDT